MANLLDSGGRHSDYCAECAVYHGKRPDPAEPLFPGLAAAAPRLKLPSCHAVVKSRRMPRDPFDQVFHIAETEK